MKKLFFLVGNHGDATGRLSPWDARRRQVSRGGSLAAACCCAAIVSTWALAASAQPTLSSIALTGANVPAGQGGQDSSWQVVAWPVNGQSKPSVPYAAWVFSGSQGGGANVPAIWLGGAENLGSGGARWIGLRENDATAALPDAPPPGAYSAIYATTFTASEAGEAFLSLEAAADNRLSFFVNGSIAGADTDLPTITGGTQLGSTIQGFGILRTVAGTVPVISGPNTLYAVVEDLNTNGTYGYTGMIVVPEPWSLASAGVGAGLLGLRLLRRRSRR